MISKNIQEIAYDYQHSTLLVDEIIQKYRIQYPDLYNIIDSLNIPRKTKKYDHFRADKKVIAEKYGYQDIDHLIADWYRSGKSGAEIGKLIELSAAAVLIKLKRLGIPRRSKGGPNNVKKYKKKWKDIAEKHGYKTAQEMFVDFRVNHRLSSKIIGRKIGQSAECVQNQMRKYQIKINGYIEKDYQYS